MLEAALSYLKSVGKRLDDDNIDRLHCFITSNVLIGLSVLVSWKTFGGKPLECIYPAKFPDSWEQMLESTLSYVSRFASHGYLSLTDWVSSVATPTMLTMFAILVSWRMSDKPIDCIIPRRLLPSFQALAATMVLESVMGMARYLSVRRDDDLIDRAHYFISANLLIGLSILVSFKQFGGKPIECMFPSKLPGSWEQYAENYCWSQDTYYVAPDQHVANLDETTRNSADRQLSYYQWVPFFLLFQAACFRLPSLIWKYLAGHSGIRIHEIVKMAIDPNNINPECKKNNIAALTTHLQNALRFQRRIKRKGVRPHKVVTFLNLPYSTYFVTCTYLVTKLLYLINVVVQLYIMNRFLKTDKNSWYGFGVIQDILNGEQSEKSGVFPRVSVCDFQVRQMGNIHNYSVQCVLVINIFNEKIFVLQWFWYTALAFVTFLSFFYWFFIMVLPWFSRWFITRNLELSEMPFDPQGSRRDVNRFVDRYLRSDGVFVLRMITMHSGIIFGTDLVLSLWKAFYGIEEQYRKDHPNDNPSKKDNANNMLRLRKRSKKNKGLDDDDVLVAGLVASKLHRSNSSKSSTSEDDIRKGKQPSAPPEPSLIKSMAIAEAVNVGLDMLHSSADEQDRPTEDQRKDY